MEGAHETHSIQYVSWQVSLERQRYEWMRLRRSIVSTRIRIVVVGHILFFAGCLGLKEMGGASYAWFFALGWWSLFFVSSSLLIFEWLHVKTLPRVTPRFAIRQSGLTEYGQDGPRLHLNWQRACRLSIETEHFHPHVRSLVIHTQSETGWRCLPWTQCTTWIEKFGRFYIPLPDNSQSAENEIVAAIGLALENSGICWKPLPNGSISLLHPCAVLSSTNTVMAA